jgi:hypothetical protein
VARGIDFSFQGKYVHEFGAKRRIEADTYWATMSFSFKAGGVRFGSMLSIKSATGSERATIESGGRVL